MKKINLYISLSLLLMVSAQTTCKKQEQEKAPFNGTSRIKGMVFFQNIVTGTRDTAKTAQLKITKNGGDATQYYLISLTDGTYDINGFSGGNYTFHATFTTGISGSNTVMTYEQDLPVTVIPEVLNAGNNLIIRTVTSSKPLLLLKVTDPSSAPLSNVRVCLYTDQLALQKNQNTCNGSTRSVLSNKAGNAVFADMTNDKYYATAYLANGSDTSSNRAVALTTVYGPYPKALIDTPSVKIQPERPTLTVTVLDQNNAQISGAQVCIYSDLDLITNYKSQCTGSLKSGTTGNNGSVVFSGMQPLAYYISASKTIGSTTLFNTGSYTTPTSVLNAGTVNSVTVVIK